MVTVTRLVIAALQKSQRRSTCIWLQISGPAYEWVAAPSARVDGLARM